MLTALRAGFAGLSIAQRLLGLLLLVLVWALPALLVWASLSAKAEAQFALGQADARAECATARADNLGAAIREAREEWLSTQDAITDQAGKDARVLAQYLADARQRAGRITEEFRDYAAAHPLPAGCRADPGRVRLFNRARGGAAPAG